MLHEQELATGDCMPSPGTSLILPIGTPYLSSFHGGQVVTSIHEGKLIYWWGAKGHCGMQARPVYMIPILGGHVCEYIDPENIYYYA